MSWVQFCYIKTYKHATMLRRQILIWFSVRAIKPVVRFSFCLSTIHIDSNLCTFSRSLFFFAAVSPLHIFIGVYVFGWCFCRRRHRIVVSRCDISVAIYIFLYIIVHSAFCIIANATRANALIKQHLLFLLLCYNMSRARVMNWFLL